MSFQSSEQTTASKSSEAKPVTDSTPNGTGIDPGKISVLDLLKGAAKATMRLDHQLMLAGEGAVTGGLLNPVNLAIKGFDRMAGANLPQVEFSNQDEVNNSWAGTIGKYAAMGAEALVGGGLAMGAIDGTIAGAGLLGSQSALWGGVGLIGTA